MALVNTKFEVPCQIDRAVIAIQDVIDGLGWQLIELSQTRIVVMHPPLNAFQSGNFPQITMILAEVNSGTAIDVSVSAIGPIISHGKKRFVGIMGQMVNSISLRVQTNSIAINPTVSIGEGQGGASGSGVSRIDLLERLQKLRNDGVLTQDEFETEKQKVLGDS